MRTKTRFCTLTTNKFIIATTTAKFYANLVNGFGTRGF